MIEIAGCVPASHVIVVAQKVWGTGTGNVCEREYIYSAHGCDTGQPQARTGADNRKTESDRNKTNNKHTK